MPCLLERSLKDIESELLRFCKGAKIPADKPWKALSSAQTQLHLERRLETWFSWLN